MHFSRKEYGGHTFKNTLYVIFRWDELTYCFIMSVLWLKMIKVNCVV